MPVVILPYYCSIGGWVLKYLSVFLTGHGTAAAEDGYFTGYITGTWQPIVWLGIYLFLTAFVVYRGVNKGIENYSKILMPILLILIIGISVFSDPDPYRCRRCRPYGTAGYENLSRSKF